MLARFFIDRPVLAWVISIVIVQGLQRVQQGATVNPTLVSMPEPAPGSLSPTAAPVLKAPAPAPKK